MPPISFKHKIKKSTGHEKNIIKALALLIKIILILVSLELFLRLNPRLGYNYIFSKQFQAGSTYRPDLRPSAVLGYENVPNSGPWDWYSRKTHMVNSYGMLGKEYKLHKDKGTFRILVLGDSIAAEEWGSDFLEEYLNNDVKLKSRYKNFEIWNAGVTSYDVRRYALYLKYKGLQYEPDMLIIFFCLNDFDLDTSVYFKTKDGNMDFYFSTSAISKRYIVNPFFMKHSYLYRFIILRLNSYLLHKTGSITSSPEEENGRYYLQMIKEICESKRIPLLAVIFPYLMPLNEYELGQIGEYEIMSKVNKDLKINYLDLHECLPGAKLSKFRKYEEDHIHPGREGYRYMAKIIYEHLLATFFKDK